jgi:hypothetical protein
MFTLDQQSDIWRNYFGSWDTKGTFTNPLRRDKSPKCYFKVINDKILFIDWANNPTHTDCISFVSQKYNLTNKEAINKINYDLKYTDKVKGNFSGEIKGVSQAPLSSSSLKDQFTSSHEEEKIVYNVKFKNGFEKHDLVYWKKFSITEITLKKYNVIPVKFVFRNGVLNYSSSEYNPIFAYCDGGIPYKIYNPVGIKMQKWRTIKAVLEGYKQLEYKTNVLFITSSLKDTMCLHEMGFDAFNLPSENSYKILLPIIEDLFSKFEHIYVYLNNDDAGKRFSRLLTLEIDQRLKYINNPSNMEQTDPSDVIKDLGQAVLMQILKDRLQRDNVIFKTK